MKKYLITFSLLLFLPAFVFAADNAVVHPDVILTVGTESVTVSGNVSNSEAIYIDGDNSFDVSLSAGQYIQITSTDKRNISITETASIRKTTSECGSSSSIYRIENPQGGATATTTITVASSGTCTSGGGGSSGGGGGGGGGGSYTYVPPTTTKTTTMTTAPKTTTTTTGTTGTTGTTQTSGAVLTKTIKVGASSYEIKTLQQFLNSDPDTKISASGAGSPGSETNYFGSLTVKAIQKFQKKYGIVSSGTPETTGYGALGPKTRAKFNELMKGGTSTTTQTTTQQTTQTTQPTTTQADTIKAQIDALMAQVLKMQTDLKTIKSQ